MKISPRKKIALYLYMAAIFYSPVTHSQNFVKTYAGSGSESASSIYPTLDGGYIVAGQTDTWGSGWTDFFLLKLASNGNVSWLQTYGGSASDEYFWRVRQTADQGYIMAGTSYSFGSGGDGYIVKATSTGAYAWSRNIGGAAIDDGTNVWQNADGTFMLVGNTSSFGLGGEDAYLAKFASDGTFGWMKTYGGSTGYDEGWAGQQTADGGFILAGYTACYGAGFRDVYLVKTNSAGTVSWTKTYGGSGDDEAYAVQQTADGGYIITGFSDSFGSGTRDVYLIKTNSLGNVAAGAGWSKVFGENTYDEYGDAVQQLSTGEYVVSGTTTGLGLNPGISAMYLLKVNSSGSLLWSKTYSGTTDIYCYDARQTTDGGFALAGYTGNFSAGGDMDVYVIKTDASGNIGSGGCDEPVPGTITTATPGESYSTGNVGTTPAVTPQSSLTSSSGWTSTPTALCATLPIDILSFTGENIGEENILRWRTAEEINNNYFIVEKSIDGNTFEEIGRVEGAGNSSTPRHYSFTDKYPLNGDFSTGAEPVMVYRLKQFDYNGHYTYSQRTSIAIEHFRVSGMTVSPVPVSSELTCRFQLKENETVSLSIVDMLGNIMYEEVFPLKKDADQIRINTTGLTGGMYFLKLTCFHGLKQALFIKE